MDLFVEFIFYKKKYQLDQRASKLSEIYFNEWIKLNEVIARYTTLDYGKRLQILDRILIVFEQSDASGIDLVATIQYNLNNFIDFIAEEYLEKLSDSFPDED